MCVQITIRFIGLPETIRLAAPELARENALSYVISSQAANTGEIELDLGFFRSTYPISVALAGTFVLGMLFGMLCMTAFVFRLISERRNLKRSLRISESEVSSLRNLPLADAD